LGLFVIPHILWEVAAIIYNLAIFSILNLEVPALLGNDVVTGWATPCVPYGGASDQGFVTIPEVDAGVWVEFEAGDLEFPIWVGTFWSKPGGATELPKPVDVQSPPTTTTDFCSQQNTSL
jgi:hypothetical protein